jgi:SAM-dependent methyltransferase
VVNELDTRFAPVARALREAIIEHYANRREPLDHPAGLRTLDTNSTLVAARGAIVLGLLRRSRGTPSLDGVDVVDLGCGFGGLSLYLAVAGARVVGVDPNAERFGVAERLAARFRLDARFVQGWMEELRLEDQAFDVAVMNNSLCYLVARADRRRAFGHALRVLRPGGWLVIRDPARAAPLDPFSGWPFVHQLPPRLSRHIVRVGGAQRSDVRLRSRPAARRELRVAGFDEVRSWRIDEPRLRPRRYQHLAARRPPLERLRRGPLPRETESVSRVEPGDILH